MRAIHLVGIHPMWILGGRAIVSLTFGLTYGENIPESAQF